MPFKHTCQSCRATMQIPDELAGTEQTCPRCKNLITLTAPTAAPPDVAPAPIVTGVRRPLGLPDLPAGLVVLLALLFIAPVGMIGYALWPAGEHEPTAEERQKARQSALDEQIKQLADRLKQGDASAQDALFAHVDSDDELSARCALRELHYHLKPSDLPRLAERFARASQRDLKNQIVTCTLQFKQQPEALRIYKLAGTDADPEVRRHFYAKIAPLATYRYRAIQRLVERVMAEETDPELRKQFKNLQ